MKTLKTYKQLFENNTEKKDFDEIDIFENVHDVDILQYYIDNGGDINIVKKYEDYPDDQVFDINGGGNGDNSLLMWAVRYADVTGNESAKMLIDAGADVNFTSSGESILSVAVLNEAGSYESDADIIKDLIDAGADVNFIVDIDIVPYSSTFINPYKKNLLFIQIERSFSSTYDSEYLAENYLVDAGIDLNFKHNNQTVLELCLSEIDDGDITELSKLIINMVDSGDDSDWCDVDVSLLDGYFEIIYQGIGGDKFKQTILSKWTTEYINFFKYKKSEEFNL